MWVSLKYNLNVEICVYLKIVYEMSIINFDF